MYIEVSVDLSNYEVKIFDLRISNYYTIKKLIDIAWQTSGLSTAPREGYWVHVVNKNKTFPGHLTLSQCGVLTGDRIKIL